MYHVSNRQCAAAQVQPVIAELLRTCVHPPTLTLQIEHIIRSITPHSNKEDGSKTPGCVTKLFLTDGHLLIQALLHRKLSTLPGIENLSKGDIVEIHEYVVKKARKKCGQGHVVYLGIDNCYVIKEEGAALSTSVVTSENQDKATTETRKSASTLDDETNESDLDEKAGGFIREEMEPEVVGHETMPGGEAVQHKPASTNSAHVTTTMDSNALAQNVLYLDMMSNEGHQMSNRASNSYFTPAKRKRAPSSASSSDEDNDQAFETVRINLGTARKRRLILHELSQNIRSSPSRPPTRDSVGWAGGRSPAMNHNSTDRPRLVRFDTNESINPPFEAVAMVEGGQLQSVNEVTNGKQARFGLVPTVADACDSHSSPPHKLMVHSNQPSSRPTTPVPPQPQSQTLQQGPFHTLLSLYSPNLPSKSYMFTTLVVPTYVATHLISRPNSLFPPKRHIKVIDPSLASKLNVTSKSNILNKGITVAVYRDASSFKPIVGRVALMRGVVMQRLRGGSADGPSETRTGEVILNVYPAKSRIQRQSQGSLHGQSQDHGRAQQGGNNQYGTVQQRTQLATLNNTQPTRRSEAPVNQYGIEPRPQSANSALSKELPEMEWFIDDHDLLRERGYAVDALQSWWDRIMNTDSNATN